MIHRIKMLTLTFFVLAALLLTVRTAYWELSASPAQPTGTILVWHGWDEGEAAVLQEIMHKYADLHPNTNIILSRVENALLLERFEEAAAIGFGPDLFLGPSEWMRPLIDTNLITSIDSGLDETLRERYLPAALETLRYDQKLYGVPVAVHTLGLYYNKTLVTQPATSLDELMAQAQTGTEIGMNTAFDNAFWGIRAFGGRLFDEEGRVILDQGGFANWLNWLKSAQDVPAFILSNDQNALRLLFAEGRLGYLVDSSQARETLQTTMEADAFGVLPLPAGPTGTPGPFLRVETLFFSRASSKQQIDLALDLARFLTNAEQQTTLMRQTARIPANTRVRSTRALARWWQPLPPRPARRWPIPMAAPQTRFCAWATKPIRVCWKGC